MPRHTRAFDRPPQNACVQAGGPDSSWGDVPYYPAANPVDIPDSTYLDRYSSPVTVTPFYTW